MWEIALLHLHATGSLRLASMPGDAWYAHSATLLLLLSLPWTQTTHFYFIHRFMHAWNTRTIPDVGKWLYRHVHSLHHRSKDPSAFSGISMHPLESAIFFSTMGLAALCSAHPIVILHCKFYNISAAMLGHESFGGPSTGGYAHWVHHMLVNCNYGNNFVPLDHWMGTYAADEADFARKFGGESEAHAGGKKAAPETDAPATRRRAAATARAE